MGKPIPAGLILELGPGGSTFSVVSRLYENIAPIILWACTAVKRKNPPEALALDILYFNFSTENETPPEIL